MKRDEEEEPFAVVYRSWLSGLLPSSPRKLWDCVFHLVRYFRSGVLGLGGRGAVRSGW
jgi:hypothetical protein